MLNCTAIFIPTYKRPYKVAPLTKNLNEVTKSKFNLYFIVEKNDSETIEAIKRVGEKLIINPGPPTYASCINSAYEQTSEPFFFAGADDILFRNNWLEEALACMLDTKSGVVGTHDPLHPLPDHTTHYLVRRSYIEDHSGCMDIPNTVLYPYWHGLTDWEFIGVAKARRMYAYCEKSVVEHIHPGWNLDGTVNEQSPLFDETYSKGNRYHDIDMREFIKRSEQWIEHIENKTYADKKIKRRIFIEHKKILRIIRNLSQLIRHLLVPYCPRLLRKPLEAKLQVFEKYSWGLMKRVA